LPSGNATLHVQENVALGALTTLGVGGRARWFTHATTVEEVRAAHQWASERGRPLFVLGGGSNLVVADEGVNGLVLLMAIRGVGIREDGGATIVDCGAGEPWDDLVARTVARRLAGIECHSGIPGSAGGTPIQNVGAYGQEVANTIASVTVVDRATNEVAEIAGRACGFAYRQSRFKQDDAGRFTVCRVVFHLQEGPPTVTYPDVAAYVERHGLRQPGVADVRAAVLAIRRGKGMVLDPDDADTRSVGSFFMNPIVAASTRDALGSPGFAMPDGDVKVPAAWLIERAGFAKGYVRGRVGVSSKHPLAIINRGGASARDIVQLAVDIKRAVIDRFGIWLRPEPVFVGLDGNQDVQFLQKANG
jgi:UDP-N-acetylmuramate dehydrogenase